MNFLVRGATSDVGITSGMHDTCTGT